jgi:hypothetical protein
MSVQAPGGSGDPSTTEVLPPIDLTAEPDQIAAPLASLDDSTGPSTKPTITDWARITLAGSLVGILAILTLGTGWYVAAYPGKETAIENFLKLVFTPIIGLVGSVIGFYFGSHTTGSSSNGK